MKLSLRMRDDDHKNPLFKAKLPITFIGLPFLSGIIAGDPSDLSFNLSTNFPTGPSLKLSYTPTPTTVTPFALSLRSGIGLFGSTRDSPLIISARLNLFSTNNPNPTFSLHIKPQFGQFSLHKSTHSNPTPNPIRTLASENARGVGLDGFVPEGSMGWTNITLESCSQKIGVPNPTDKENGGIGPERPLVWRDLTMESCNGTDGILSGVKVRANTALPLTSRFVANFRWGLNFPAENCKKLPYLTVDKIGFERVEEVKDNKRGVVEKRSVGEVEVLKDMCNWMRSDLEVLQKENLDLKQSLESIKSRILARNYGAENKKFEANPVCHSVVKTGDSKWRKSKTSVEGNDDKKETRKAVDCVSDIESELQKAIKAASS